MTISYLDPILPVIDRQTYLKERYGFTCTCSLCTSQSQAFETGSAPVPPAPAPLTQPQPDDLSALYRTVVAPAMELASSLAVQTLQTGSSTSSQPLDALRRLPSRVQPDRLPPSLARCLQPDVVTELVTIFSQLTIEAEWRSAMLPGMHMVAVYATLYGWRHPLTGEWYCFCSQSSPNTSTADVASRPL